MHALTDITGFGLLGHGLELVRAAKLKMQLLVSCAPDVADEVLACFHDQGLADARAIGRITEGSGVEVLQGCAA